jgi:hypothetical protein|nr:hypothetical protein [Kofleriaceae bacterium]
MTETPETSTPEPETDHVAARAVIAAIVVMVAAIALSIPAVWLLVGAFDGGGEAQAMPATVEPPSVPFPMSTAGETHRALVRARLDGWTRLDATHVRVPIGVAIDRLCAPPSGGAARSGGAGPSDRASRGAP